MMTDLTVIDCDIAIVGGAMAGSALACALAGSGYRIAMVEQAVPAPFSRDDFFDPRVVALNGASRQLLSSVGAWDLITAQRVSPYERMQVWDADGTAQVQFDAAELQHAALGHIVENSLVVWALQQCLAQAADVQWLRPDTVTGLVDHPAHSLAELTLRSGAVLRATLVIAADGAVSSLRQLAGIRTVEWDYGHTAVVATVRTQEPHQRTARQRFMASGPLALLPLRSNDGDEHWSSIVWSTGPEAAQSLLALPEQDFAAQLGRSFEHRLGEVLEVRGRFAFPLRQRHAQVYHAGRVVLVGDAAHTIHPLAGQGVNLGFMDVKVLAEELCDARARGIAPSHPAVLKRYQRRRRGANLTMTATMELFRRLFARTELPLRWLRNTGMNGIDSLPLVKQEIMRRAMGF